jgi:hypothetical protein
VDARSQQAGHRPGGASGGTLSDKELSVEFLASAALAGVSPDKFLKAETDIELKALELVAIQAIEYQKIQQRNQAILIIQYLGKALGSDKKKSDGVQRRN